ncbi:UNVERIFIED_ORG: hypothetical protein GGI63_003553, partial [Rhizobium esperanzae]
MAMGLMVACKTAIEMLVMAMATRRQIGNADWFRLPGGESPA